MESDQEITHASLFSGIGGFDLAADKLGWKNIFHCEINQFCQKILKYYWPNSKSYEDIKTTDFTIYRGKIDVLSGGFPCQPFSVAGLRKGAEDDRYLWPEMLRSIDEIRPTWVVGENVAGLASMVQPEAVKTYVESQTNFFGEVDQEIISEYQQYVIETVCSDLERIGYSVQPIVIPACAIGAPHRRDRIWFIAHTNNDAGRSSKSRRNEEKERIFGKTSRFSFQRSFTNSADSRIESLRKSQERIFEPESITNTKCGRGLQVLHKNERKQPKWTFINSIDEQIDWSIFPTQPPICSGNDGISHKLDRITFPKWRAESVKAYGNAVVHQVVLEIYKAIQENLNLFKF